MHPKETRRRALAAAIEAGIAGRDDESATAMFMDLDIIHATINALKRAPFPPATLHSFAVKANPVGRVLELLREAGLGAEVASLGELRQALACGFPPHRVVFDSPIKTTAELRFALRAGVRLNLDNLQELQRVADLVAAEPQLLYGSTTGDGGPRLIGLRINPQVGEGSIRALSTGGRVSKFGIPLLERRRELLAAFATHPWINALHLHVGSQGVPLELTVEGIARVAELAEEIEAEYGNGNGTAAGGGGAGGGGGGAGGRRILALDIGGGLPVQYGNDDLAWLLGSTAAAAEAAAEAEAVPSIFERYAVLLKARLPSLFVAAPSDAVTSSAAAAAAVAVAAAAPPPPQLVTEFGRCLVAKSVFAAGRVEYGKCCGGRRVVVSGLGGDLLLRAVYLPETWPVRVELYGADGQPKQPPTPAPLPGDGAAFSLSDRVASLGNSPDLPAAAAAAQDQGASAAGATTMACVYGGGAGGGGVDGGGVDAGGVGAAGGGSAAGEGEEEDGSWLAPTDVVGPLCFQGDRLAEAVPLPPAQPGDWLVVPDVGAYCLSMYSRYNSRCSPPVWGFRRCTAAATTTAEGTHGVGTEPPRAEATEAAPGSRLALPAAWAAAAGGSGGGGVRRCGDYEFVLLRRGETVEEVMAFWNLLEPPAQGGA